MSFEALTAAASEIAVGKDNVAEASLTSICAISGGNKNKNCGFCNSNSHSDKGFTEEVRKKYCKAWNKTCEKCQKVNHLAVACRAAEIKKRREEYNRKNASGSVKEMSAVEETPAAAAAQGAAATAAPQTAGLN